MSLHPCTHPLAGLKAPVSRVCASGTAGKEHYSADPCTGVGGLARRRSPLWRAQAQAVPHRGQMAAAAPAVQLGRLQRLRRLRKDAQDGVIPNIEVDSLSRAGITSCLCLCLADLTACILILPGTGLFVDNCRPVSLLVAPPPPPRMTVQVLAECSLLWQAMHHLSGQLLWKAWETWRAYGQARDQARGKLAQAALCWQNARMRAAWLQWDAWVQVCSSCQACVLLCRSCSVSTPGAHPQCRVAMLHVRLVVRCKVPQHMHSGSWRLSWGQGRQDKHRMWRLAAEQDRKSTQQRHCAVWRAEASEQAATRSKVSTADCDRCCNRLLCQLPHGSLSSCCQNDIWYTQNAALCCCLAVVRTFQRSCSEEKCVCRCSEQHRCCCIATCTWPGTPSGTTPGWLFCRGRP